jgi:hypothetical protein
VLIIFSIFFTVFFVDIELKKQAFVNNHPDVTEAELEDLIEGKGAESKLVGSGRPTRPCAARPHLLKLPKTRRCAPPTPRSFAFPLFLMYCIIEYRENPRKIHVWEKSANE